MGNLTFEYKKVPSQLILTERIQNSILFTLGLNHSFPVG